MRLRLEPRDGDAGGFLRSLLDRFHRRVIGHAAAEGASGARNAPRVGEPRRERLGIHAQFDAGADEAVALRIAVRPLDRRVADVEQ
jgi:hypothetical protein